MISPSQQAHRVFSVLVPVPGGTLPVPVHTICGKTPGPSVVITAGMDGDELAGIDAALSMSETYARIPITGTLTIIPIVNIPGWQNNTSYAPEDGLYPKLAFPGKPDGTHTQQLTHWLYTGIISPADTWIDLHGGSLTESLTPFVWMSQTTNRHIRQFQDAVLTHTSARTVVHDRRPFMPYVRALDKQSIRYIMLECGGQGSRTVREIDTIRRWTDEILAVCGITQTKPEPVTRPDIYTTVTYVRAPTEGYWIPSGDKANIVGTIRTLHNRRDKTIPTAQGTLLWSYTGSFCRKGDILAAYGR